MPLLRHFAVVGSALTRLLYLASAVLPHDTRIIYIKSNSGALPTPRQPQQHAAAVPESRTEPTLSFAAGPVESPAHIMEPAQKFNVAAAPIAQHRPQQKGRTPVLRQARASSRCCTSRQLAARRAAVDRSERTNDSWRDPFWGSNWRAPGWW
jgi:hypothetical protein